MVSCTENFFADIAEKTLFWENIGFKVINFENYDKIYFNKKWKEEK